jgi:hypothetical protein
MSTSRSRRFPVIVTQLPVPRCQICRRTVAYRPGKVSEDLTGHYRRAHPQALGLPSRNGTAETLAQSAGAAGVVRWRGATLPDGPGTSPRGYSSAA